MKAWKTPVLGAAAVAAMLLASGNLTKTLGAQESDPKVNQMKGIYVDPGAQKPGVKFNVLLKRGTTAERKVSTTQKFVNGDRLSLEVEANKQSYLYVLNRTISGNPDRLEKYSGKGIDVIRDDDRRDTTGKYTLLYPTDPNAGNSNRVPARKMTRVPQDAQFFMDEEPGLEKVFLVLSDKPLDLKKHFKLVEGKWVSGELSQLGKDLSDWSRNGDAAFAKGMGVDSYGIGVDGAKPMMVELELKHYAK